jgi:hypothetical protein
MRRLLVVLLLGCGGSSSAPDADPSQPISRFEVVENRSNVLSRFVSWRTIDPVATRLEVDCGDYAPAFHDDTPRTEHEVFLLGLYPGARCTLRAIAPTGEASIDLEVGDVPEALPRPQVSVTLDSGPYPSGYALVNLSNAAIGHPLTVAMFDTQGRYRWYHVMPVTEPGSDSEVRVVPEGVLVGGLRGLVWPTIVGWDGTVVWQEEFHMHHDIRPDGEGRFLYLDGSSEGCAGGYWSDQVKLWDRARREVVWSWHICEHFTPPVLQSDWSHVNTIEPVPGEDALLLSSRNQDLLLKIDRGTGEVLWTLGAGGDIELPAGDEFFRQHAPEIQPNGNILLFDNGLAGVRETSRAIEIAYEVDQGTAEIVWEFEAPPELFAPIWGDADRTPEGNTLITFGRRGPDIGSHLVEVLGNGGTWELIFPHGWGVYRADRVIDPPVGFIR